MNTPIEQLEKDDLQYVQNKISTNKLPDRFILERGKGCTVWDVHGNAYIDAHASAWLCQIGHGRREMAELAAEQMMRLEHFTTHDEFRNPHTIALSKKLVDLSPISDGKVIYGTSGSDSDDKALQLVRQYQKKRGLPKKTTVLVLEGAYHGDTYGGMQLMGEVSAVPGQETIQLTMPDDRRGTDADGNTETDRCVAQLKTVIEDVGADKIAAMFGEPVFGPAGMFQAPADYWPRMVEVLHANDILFVADEVVTAFGRCGEMYGSTLCGIKPDVMVMAKGIASGYAVLSTIIISGAIAEVLNSGHHGGSYAGNPVACALALRNIEIIEKEQLCKASRERGAQMIAELNALKGLPGVLDVRGVGLMVSIWMDPSKARDTAVPLDRKIRDSEGVIVMGDYSSLVITPPLTVSEAEVTKIVQAIGRVLSREYSNAE